VAALSFLLGFLLKKVGNVVQIVLGWSVTAPFGRLSASKQILLTVALVLSVVWPANPGGRLALGCRTATHGSGYATRP